MRQSTAILQSCTAVPASCSYTTLSDGAHEAISIKVEEDSGVTIKEEENPEPISFPPINSNQMR